MSTQGGIFNALRLFKPRHIKGLVTIVQRLPTESSPEQVAVLRAISEPTPCEFQFPKTKPLATCWQITQTRLPGETEEEHRKSIQEYVERHIRKDKNKVTVVCSGTYVNNNNPENNQEQLLKKIRKISKKLQTKDFSGEVYSAIFSGHIGAHSADGQWASFYPMEMKSSSEALKQHAYLLCRQKQRTAIYLAQFDLSKFPSLLRKMEELQQEKPKYHLTLDDGKDNCSTYVQKAFGIHLNTMNPLKTLHGILDWVIESTDASEEEKDKARDVLYSMGLARGFEAVSLDELRYKDGVPQATRTEKDKIVALITDKPETAEKETEDDALSAEEAAKFTDELDEMFRYDTDKPRAAPNTKPSSDDNEDGFNPNIWYVIELY